MDANISEATKQHAGDFDQNRGDVVRHGREKSQLQFRSREHNQRTNGKRISKQEED